MGGWVALMARWNLYLILALAFVAGVFGLKTYWMATAEAKLRAKIEAKRRAAIEDAKEIRNEVEALDRDTLKRRAAKWVRNPSK